MPLSHDSHAEPVSIVFPESKNTQRLASFCLIAALSSPSRATPLQTLCSRYRELLCARHVVPKEQQNSVISYLRKRNLLRKYDVTTKDNIVVEAQDWFLSDPSIPSGTGAEKEDSRPTVALATQLGLLWPNTYQRTWCGDILFHFRPEIVESFRAQDRQHNPYILTPDLQMVFAWLCLNKDMTFLSFLIQQILRLKSSFTLPEIIEQVGDGLPDLASLVLQSAKDPRERNAAKELSNIVERITRKPVGRKAKPGGVTTQTIRRTFEQIILWRIEALVDIGYLGKQNPQSYAYSMSDQLIELDKLLNDGKIERLRSVFFTHWREATEGITATRMHPPEILSLLMRVNREKSNKMGYTLIEEAVILGNSILHDEGLSTVLEFDDVVQCIVNRQKSSYKIITSVDKNRQLSAFKIRER